MNLNQLYYFRTLAQLQHYGQAAAQLHITQPSLTNAIHQMEKELDTYLFQKSGRGVVLTRAGKRYLDYVNEALDALERGNDFLFREQSECDGYLDLGAISSIVYHDLPEWIRSFQEKHQVSLYYSCRSDISSNLAKDLARGRYDYIFCTAQPDVSPDITFVPVLEQKLGFFMPKGHPLYQRSSVDIHELEGERMILHSRSAAMYGITKELFQKAGVHVRVSGDAQEDRAIIGLLRAGLGCAVMTISPEVHGTGFRAVPLTGTDYRRYVCLGYRSDQARTNVSDLFLRHILSGALRQENKV